MPLPRKFIEYPWITGVVAVALVLITLWGFVELLGAEWVAAQLERLLIAALGSAGEGSTPPG